MRSVGPSGCSLPSNISALIVYSRDVYQHWLNVNFVLLILVTHNRYLKLEFFQIKYIRLKKSVCMALFGEPFTLID